MQGGGQHGRLESRHLAEIETGAERRKAWRARATRRLVEWIGARSQARGKGNEAARWRAQALARPYAHPYFWAGFIHTGL